MDDAQRVYHMKQVRGRPFVRRTDVADSLQIGQIFVTEFADRKSLGFLVDSEKRFYTLGAEDYKLHEIPVGKLDVYKRQEYDTGPLKDMEFTGPPQLEWLPYKDKTVFQTVGVKTNGSRTFKQGIEFSLSTRRIRALATKLIVSGAYFKTRYENSEPQYVLTTVQLAEGTPYPYRCV